MLQKSQVHNACCLNPDYAQLIAMSRMSDVIKCTDLSLTRKMSPHGGFQLFLKREDQQLGFSPHVRGIYNSMSHITPENRWRGVVIPSKGQYARAIACSAQLLKIPAVILAESGICPNEMRELQQMGSIVDLPSDKPSGPLSAAFNLQAFYVDPLDDPYTLAGLGTVALEILKQIQDYQNLQAIFCSVRAAGLLEAIGLSVKHFSPNVKVIGVDSLPSTELSKLYGASTDPADTNFDAQITSPLKGSQDHLPVVSQDHLDRTLTTEISRVNPHVVDDIIMVKACEVQSAIRDVFQETRAIVDLNGALAVAGMTRYASVTGSLDAEQRVKSLVAVLSSADVVFEDIKAFI